MLPFSLLLSLQNPPDRVLGQLLRGQRRDPRHLNVALLHGQQYLARGRRGHAPRHFRRDFAQQRVGEHDADRPGDHVRPAAVDPHGVFAGGPGARARLEHGGGGQHVGADRNDFGLRRRGPQPLGQRAAHSPALAVDDDDSHMR